MGTARPLLGSALVALALLSGCGGAAQDTTSKELSALTAEISKMRAEQAAMAERLEALERAKAPLPAPVAAADPRPAAAPEPAPARSLDSDRPSLDVVKLGPVASDVDGDIDEESPRTVLRSGSNVIVVEESDGAAAGSRTVLADPKKTAKKTDKAKTSPSAQTQ